MNDEHVEDVVVDETTETEQFENAVDALETAEDEAQAETNVEAAEEEVAEEKPELFKIWLDEDGNEDRREPLGPGKHPKGSHKDDAGNLICPYREPVGEKTVHYKIYLDENGNEVDRKVRGKGRIPKRAYRDDDGNTVIPWQEPQEKATSEPVVKTKVYLAKDGETVIDTVQFTKGRLPARAYVDPDDPTRFFVPWQEPKGKKKDTPVVAEQDAPPVEVVEVPETAAEPADTM